ncbi:MAG: FKBP-type peptidyl-prolyl cis-trans isomerase [Bacteroidetes bacterium]|nr:MAG: FKBP-type peptidyl-prolyl cis-trans isomerase [Bacteroidota bacterium]
MNKLSYSLGVNIGEGMKQQGFSIEDFESFANGLRDVYEKNIKIKPEELNQILNDEYVRIQTDVVDAKREDGEKFLSENAKRDEVTITNSGLQYEVIKEGKGDVPTADKTVTVHYHGTLPNGKVFDSSVDRGQPASFPVTGVIKGWVEALQIMKTGSKYRLFIPSDLAYGAQGAGGDIGPHQALVFDVELLSIDK